MKLLKIIGIISIGMMITGCSHRLGQKIAVESINDPYALYNGINVPYDLNKAFSLAKKQCEENNLDSCFLYAYLLDKGEGTKQDKATAYKIFEKSCEGFEETKEVIVNGSAVLKTNFHQNLNACYFVAKKFFEEKNFIEAYKNNEKYLSKLNRTDKYIAKGKTNETIWDYERVVFEDLGFNKLNSYNTPRNPISEKSKNIYQEQKKGVILFDNITKIKSYASNILAYYDFRISTAQKAQNNKEAFLYKKNKAVLLEALGRVKEAEAIYKENCELNDSYSCIYYKNIKVRGSNLK